MDFFVALLLLCGDLEVVFFCRPGRCGGLKKGKGQN